MWEIDEIVPNAATASQPIDSHDFAIETVKANVNH